MENTAPVIDYEGYIDGLIAKARAAQAIARQYDQARVDELCETVSFACVNDKFRAKAAQMLIDEAHMGNYESKFNKIKGKSMGVYRDMKGEKSVGIIKTDIDKGLVTYIKPMGVVAAILPVTNGEATPIVKSLWTLKCRNAIIFSPARAGKTTAKYVVDYVRKVLKSCGAPEDLVQIIEPEFAGREAAAFLNKKADFIVATGGSKLVKAAYSSGTPAIGVGAGNATTYIDETADLDDAAQKICRSQVNDYSTSCSSENNAVVNEKVYDAFIEACKKVGAIYIKNDSPDKQKLINTLWPAWATEHDHTINKKIAARKLKVIMDAAGIECPEDATFCLVEEFDGFGKEFPLLGEKLSPVLTIVKAKDFDDALDKMENILKANGMGHSCGIHCSTMHPGDSAKIDKLAERMNVARILVNQPQSLGNSGAYFNGLPITMSLGCATWGGNSTCENVTWRDCCNTTTVSWPIEEIVPTIEGLYSEKTRKVCYDDFV